MAIFLEGRHSPMVRHLSAFFFVLLATQIFCLASLGKDRILVSTVKGFYTTALLELSQRYMEMHPDILVQVNLQPDNLSINRFYTAQMAADRRDAPDIVHGNLLGVAENFHSGRFLALNDYLDQPNPYANKIRWRDLFEGAFLQTLAIDGVYECILPMAYVDVGIYYNQDIFVRHNLEIPTSWEQWVDLSSTLKEKDLIPLSVAGSANGDTTGWLQGMLFDACMRKFLPLFIARPGDWNYADANAEFRHRIEDPYLDQFITLSPERYAKAFLEGEVSFEMPIFTEACAAYRRISHFFEPGHLGTDQAGAYNLFLTSRAAMWLIGSWRVGSLNKDVKELPENMQFDWSVFSVPSLENAKYIKAPLRGIGGAGHQLSVVNKLDEKHHQRVIDFLMYLFSPRQASYLVERTLEVGEYIQGAPIIEGASLPIEIAEKLDAFGGRGYEKTELLPMFTDNEFNSRIRPWYQLLSIREISVEEYLEEFQRLAMNWVERQIVERGFDLDPTTRE